MNRSQQLKDLAARRRQYSRDAERCEQLADQASAPGGEGLGVAATWRGQAAIWWKLAGQANAEIRRLTDDVRRPLL